MPASSLKIRLTAIWSTVILSSLAGGLMAILAHVLSGYYHELLGGKPLPMLTQWALHYPALYAYPLFFILWAGIHSISHPPSEKETLLLCISCLILTFVLIAAFALGAYLPQISITTELSAGP